VNLAGIRAGSVASQLALLVLVVTAPLAGLTAYLLHASAQADLARAADTARQMAATTADRTQRQVESLRTMLEALARRPLVRAMDPQRCEPALADLLQLQPRASNIVMVDREGRIICGAIPPPPGRELRVVDLKLHELMLSDPRFRLSPPIIGRVTQRWTVSAIQPVLGEDGKPAGTLSMALNLADWLSFAGIATEAQQATVALITNEGILIGRSSEAEKWIGLDTSAGEVHRQAMAIGEGTVRAHGLQGIDRIWGFAPVEGANWYALAGLPVEVVFGPARTRVTRAAALGAAVFIVAMLLAFTLGWQLLTRVREDLRSREARFTKVVRHAWDVYQLMGADRRISFASASVSRILGWSPEEMVGRLSSELVHPEDVQRTAAAMHTLLATPGATVTEEVRVRHKDGSWRWVEANATNMLEEPDVRAIAVNYRDINERRMQHERIERLSRVHAVLSRINAAIVRVHDRDELFREATRIVVEDGGLAFAWIGIVDGAAREVHLAAWSGANERFIRSLRGRTTMKVTEGAGIVARAVLEKRPVVSNQVATDPGVVLKAELAALGIHSLAMLPVTVEGEVQAVLGLHAADPGYFREEEMKLFLDLVADIAFALGHLAQAEKLDYLAYFDSLTGLANRSLFLERLPQLLHAAGQAGEKVALVVADVERLRTINDSLGRQAGDALLKALAGRLAAGAERSELSRISADIFAIVMQGVKGKSEVTRRFERMWQDCFGEPFMLDGRELKISGKAGIAVFPGDGTDAESLLRSAEAALRKAKETGERHVFHEREMTAGSAEKLTLESRLRRALERGEFVLHYQPKVSFDGPRSITGVEALIRWNSPELGLVPPGQFIPLMEETGMILEAGAWAVSQAVADHARWIAEGLSAPRIAVNVSAVQLRKKDYLETLARALANGARPAGIDLELTESLLMQDIQGNIEKLRKARELGVSIAIDDFGTGYSSLGYLAKLPVQALKIDRSFIITMLQEPDTMTLVSTIISLAHALKLKVIAEGVDQEEQAKVLRLLGCDEMQGYLVSPPVPFEQLGALLRARQQNA
jgi:diguanylate cyclase (GGDEF)-like protein/PAS domain S-box-containing protein